MSITGALPVATWRQRQVGRRARAGATVPNENIAICDGVPVRSFTNVRAAFFIWVISVALMDDETSKTIPTFRPHAGAQWRIVQSVGESPRFADLRCSSGLIGGGTCVRHIVLDRELHDDTAWLVVLSLVVLEVPVLIVSRRKYPGGVPTSRTQTSRRA